jgi:hypothetical protein
MRVETIHGRGLDPKAGLQARAASPTLAANDAAFALSAAEEMVAEMAHQAIHLTLVVLDEDLNDRCLKDEGYTFLCIAKKGNAVWTSSRSLWVMAEPWAGTRKYAAS